MYQASRPINIFRCSILLFAAGCMPTPSYTDRAIGQMDSDLKTIYQQSPAMQKKNITTSTFRIIASCKQADSKES